MKLFDFIKSTAEQAGIDAHKLELELTEGVLVDNYQKAQHLLTALRKMGVTIAIDDFGTGYSSIGYLKDFDFDVLKIDKSFIDNICTSKELGLVASIIAMGRILGMKIVAEGVEEADQVEELKRIGCDYIQGFFYSRPLPDGDFERFVADQL